MKILMTLETPFPPDKRVENEIEVLVSAGYKVHLICPESRKKLETQFSSFQVHYILPSKFIRKSSVGALRFPFYVNYWKKEIRKLLEVYNFDIIHIHDLPLIKPIYELKNHFSFKIVLDLHENWPGLLSVSPYTQSVLGKLLCSIKEWENYERRYLKKADKIIVVVEEARDRILSLDSDMPEIYVVSNTLNLKDKLPQKSKRTADSGKRIFVYEGGITWHRGLQNILKALSMIGDARGKVELWIIGDGSYLKTLKKLCKSLALEENVKFFGWQPQEKIFDLLSKADIALIPHIKSEHTDTTIPHKLFHYMYVELPVIASNCNPIERIIRETNCGIVYQSDNPGSLSNILREIIHNPASLDPYKKSRRWIERKYNWDNDSLQLVNLYRSIS
ncbi:MAG: glycosyltransferase family 4 protein [Bacteroidota bacterium]|nr:glycosyltransferase family 4 protein [Bacteroidota bacterium]